ncbi:DUF3037 domain-containing protein [Halomonas sp. SpR8]|uniref:DUF3037 domain-containing protein n=1 Tax=Halomonas sp. SpR8 TaxID=3050463 RepID=UPI0027E410BC|nr:DUF3037 domain-containing protein [Halomonas sp. SpR8]MDQ7727967.1 DUF3037 domain-containing protein [Halomonas sp. SpR8]
MSIICNYAVLRFQPYPETGEFANLGIVMVCNNGQFLEMVETRTRKRITNFFDKLDPAVFTNARQAFAKEIHRVAELANAHPYDTALQLGLFKHLTAPSETMFRFSQPGTIATDNPAATLQELFNRYVCHDFTQREDAETKLKRRINTLLKEQFTDRTYREEKLGDELYHVTFPFVWQSGGITAQAIRPLSFDLDDTKSIIDKGDRWIMQMNRLAKHGGMPRDTVFICKEPTGSNADQQKVYREIAADLSSSHQIRVIPYATPQSKMLGLLASTSLH